MHDLTPPSLQNPASVALSPPAPRRAFVWNLYIKKWHLLTFISVLLFFKKKNFKETNLMFTQTLFYFLFFSSEMYLFTYLFLLHHFRANNAVLFFLNKRRTHSRVNKACVPFGPVYHQCVCESSFPRKAKHISDGPFQLHVLFNQKI